MAARARSGGLIKRRRTLAPWCADPILLGAASLLVGLGLLSLYSIGVDVPNRMGSFWRQVAHLGVGIGLYAGVVSIPLHTWKRLAVPLYIVQLLLLGAVIVIGSSRKGAERWIEIGPLQFQPSELAKFASIIVLATFLASLKAKPDRMFGFWGSLGLIAAPVALILRQPHLGAALVLLCVWMAMGIVGGLRASALLATLGAGLAVVVAVTSVPAISEKVLRGYQQNRVAGLMDRGRDTLAKNWQTDRAEIALGVGGGTGTGLFEGEQKRLRYVPEQHNDFVVTVLGEELGLLGTMTILLTFLTLFWRISVWMARASDPFPRTALAGVFAVLGFHALVNIAMVLHLVPVVGLWLPFMSYGGTALWLALACIALTNRAIFEINRT